jgi:5-methylcytosine-specific restriction endonuclease McrA
MKRCEICSCDDEEVLIKHHIDNNRSNNYSENIMILCANCHLKIHRRNFKIKFRDINLKERDYKVNEYLKTHYKFPN